jgi:hypothetical protein
LAFFASGNRSLLAAQAFVEAMLEAHVRGVGVDALEAAIRERALQSKVAEAAAAEEATAEAAGGAGGGRRGAARPLLTPLDQDILLSWMLLTALAANELGIPFGGGGAAAAGAAKGAAAAAASEGGGRSGPPPTAAVSLRFSREALGLLQYVKATLRSYFDEEYTLARVTALQALTSEQQQLQQQPSEQQQRPPPNDAGSSSGSSAAGAPPPPPPQAADPGPSGGRSQFAELMQQYTRLVLITAEVASGLGLPTSRPLYPPSGALRGRVPSGYSRAFDFGEGGGEAPSPSSSSSPSSPPPPPDLRALAVRLVVAFMGAALGEGAYSANAFAACALDAYSRGYTAGEVFDSLDAAEFAQAGGLVRATGAAAAAARARGESESAARVLAAQEVNALLFARWLSLAYFTAAQMGVPFPGAGRRAPGWAWVPGGGEGAVPVVLPAGAAVAAPEDEAGRSPEEEEKEAARGASPAPSADDAVEAAGLAAFVSQALALAAREERQRSDAGDVAADAEGADPDAAPAASPEPGSMAARLQAAPPSSFDEGGGGGGGADADLQSLLEQQRSEVARELAEQGTLRGRAVPAMVRLQDPKMAATSAAVAAFRQQLGVVGAVRAVALAGMVMVRPQEGEEDEG